MSHPASHARELIGERIEPDVRTFALSRAARGEPALPTRFTWRGRVHEIAEVEREWKTTDRKHRATGDAYVRRHWADVRTAEGQFLRIYADRGSAKGGRWWIHSRPRDGTL